MVSLNEALVYGIVCGVLALSAIALFVWLWYFCTEYLPRRRALLERGKAEGTAVKTSTADSHTAPGVTSQLHIPGAALEQPLPLTEPSRLDECVSIPELSASSSNQKKTIKGALHPHRKGGHSPLPRRTSLTFGPTRVHCLPNNSPTRAAPPPREESFGRTVSNSLVRGNAFLAAECIQPDPMLEDRSPALSSVRSLTVDPSGPIDFSLPNSLATGLIRPHPMGEETALPLPTLVDPKTLPSNNNCVPSHNRDSISPSLSPPSFSGSSPTLALLLPVQADSVSIQMDPTPKATPSSSLCTPPKSGSKPIEPPPPPQKPYVYHSWVIPKFIMVPFSEAYIASFKRLPR